MKNSYRKFLASVLFASIICLASPAHAANGRSLVLSGHSYWVKACAWNAKGNLIASGAYDGTVRVWNADSGKPVHEFQLEENQGVAAFAFSVTFSSDGKQVIAATTNGILIWNVSDGKLVRQIGNQKTPYAFAVSSIPGTKEWVAFYADRRLERWTSTSANEPEVSVRIPEEDRMPHPAHFSFSADHSKMLLTTGDENTQVHDSHSLKTLHSFSGAAYWGGALSPDGTKAVLGSMRHQPVIVDVASGAVLSQSGEFSNYISMNAWSAKNKISTGDGEGMLRMGSDEKTGHTDTIGCMAYSSKGRLVTGSHDGTLRVW